MEELKIWFFTDIHGSCLCFRKFLNLIDLPCKPDVLIIGGDITGKKIVPIIKSKTHWTYEMYGETRELRNENEVKRAKLEISDLGGYPYECSQNVYKSIFLDETNTRYKTMIDKLAKKRLQEWIDLLDERLKGKTCKVFINAGNDDPLFVDEILKGYSPEGKVIALADHLKLLSTGYSNISPWECTRDISETELGNKILEMTSELSDDDKCIFNFHCPPYNTSLDLVNEIDKETFRPCANRMVHVGSQTVRMVIEQFNPIVSFHGHIHEIYAKEYLGETLCFNPGSDFQHGKLQGAFVVIKDGKIKQETLTKELINKNGKNEVAQLENLLPPSIKRIWDFLKTLI